MERDRTRGEVEQQQDVATTTPREPTGDTFSDAGTLPGVAADQPALIVGDIMYEQLAHRFAYVDTLTDEDQKWLKAQGLQAYGEAFHGQHGFAMRSFTPLPGYEAYDRRPVLAFRGTNDFKDLVDDTNPAGIGANQLAANEGGIALALAGLQGFTKGAAVTGHSLGGAIAQMVAARFPSLVAKVVTFQSPGIPKEMADKVDDLNKQSVAETGHAAIQSHHYQVAGDLVSKAGEAFIGGKVSVIERPGTYLFRHTGYPVSAHYAAKHPEYNGVKLDGKDPGPLHVVTPHREAIEHLRAAFGRFLGLLKEIATGKEHLGYLHVWERVRVEIDNDGNPDKIASIIDGSALEAEDKRLMHDNLRRIVEATHEVAKNEAETEAS